MWRLGFPLYTSWGFDTSPKLVDQRPITLLTMTFRLWSSTKGCQILRQLAAVTPSCMRGGLEAKAASDVFVYMSALIEESLAYERPLCGASVI